MFPVLVHYNLSRLKMGQYCVHEVVKHNWEFKLCNDKALGLNPASTVYASCVIQTKLLNLSGLQFPCLDGGRIIVPQKAVVKIT